ncbi:MAG: PAS domain S-box protein [Candidatus Latescibacterota bacterium]|nr:MAG: PAS domain S-box protein [Candidatus Latescibacterota bacterium]
MNHSKPVDNVTRTLAEFGDAFQDLVGLVDKSGTLLYLNRSGREMTAIGSNARLDGETIQAYFPDWSIDELIGRGYIDDNRNRTSGLSLSRDATLLAKDGRKIATLLSVYAHLSTTYEVEFVLMVARDITALKEVEHQRETIEERLLNACRMETIGRLSVGVAQNLQRTLDRIAGNTETALRLTPENSDARAPLENTIAATHAARIAVAQIIDAGCRRHDPGKPVQIKRVIRDAVSMAEASFPGSIEVRQHLDDAGDPIAIGPERIQEIVLNLVLNARETLALTGGILDIKLDSVDVGTGTAVNGGAPCARRYARITVSDNGPGMPEDAISDIFGSSSSTAKTADSTPLGLSAINRLVEGCGGAVTVHNRIGRGTTFHVFLPAANPQDSVGV